jgi:hypothetical protein
MRDLIDDAMAVKTTRKKTIAKSKKKA